MSVRTISNGGGNWNSVGTWAEGAVPLNTDDVVATATSGNVTITATAVCQSMNLTNYINTLTHNNTINLTIGRTGVAGSLTLPINMVYAPTGSAKITLIGTAGSANITTGGQVLTNLTINGIGGTWTLQDNLHVVGSSSATGFFNITHGTFNANNKNLYCDTYIATGTTTTINMGSGTWTMNPEQVSANWNITTTNSTINVNTSTVFISNNTMDNVVIAASTKFYNLVIDGSLTTDDVSFTGSTTILNNLSFQGARLIEIASGSTVTVIGTITATGLNASNILTIVASAPPSPGFISKSSGIVSLDYLNITDNNTTGGAKFYAGAHSVNGGDTTGWIFTVPPMLLQSSGGYTSEVSGTTNLQSSGGLSGGLKGAHIQSTGDLT